MKFRYPLLLPIFILLSVFPQFSDAQITIKGVVQDSGNKDPLIGAAIVMKNNPSSGTTTDFDGNFEFKIKDALPATVVVSYLGYSSKDFVITAEDKNMVIELGEDAVTIDVVEVTGQRISDKQKAAPLTIETMDLLAIKETPSDNFYDGLGSMKGVDLTAASLGFKVINTRGFNSTSPVRSLQIIDGVDNQAPGLNFSLGNFLGTSELDVLKVDLIQGASSAFFGPNAFNGVIAMETKNPFFQKGLAASVKFGERQMFDTAIRYADAFKNKDGNDFFAFKLNFFYLRANDWEADNEDPVFDTETDRTNPGRYDAVNVYGDEYVRNFDFTGVAPWNFVGIGQYHRTGYAERDLVDYDTRNTKANVALHFRTKPEMDSESPEFIISSSFGAGTTVYQGDNRFSLKNILFFQNRLEYRKRDKWFIRAYTTAEDAGDSYDPYFTALALQDRARSNGNWGLRYTNHWRGEIEPRINELGYPELGPLQFDSNGALITDENGIPVRDFDNVAAENWLTQFSDSLTIWHNETEIVANSGGGGEPFFQPGTERFEEAFEDIRTRLSNTEEGGTRFHDKSSLYHVHGEYKMTPKWTDEWVIGANARYYTPESKGTIFYDTMGIEITNFEAGMYTGIQKKFSENKFIFNATIRVDKNENFPLLASPAVSLVYKPKPGNFLRASFSAAIRNPTLSDQYLFLNVGRATLAGNLEGVEGLYTIESFLDYVDLRNPSILESFDIPPIVPEKVKTFEIGYRTTLFNSLYVDAGYYFNIYNDFLGCRLGVGSDFDELGTPIDVTAFRYSANSLNEVTTQGFAIGLNYYFWDFFGINGNYSWNKLNKAFPDDPIIPAFNTPEHKFNIGISGRNISTRTLKNLGFNINYKWIQGFIFEGSPQFTGFIPTYSLMDAQVNYKFERIHTTLKIGASNALNNKQFQTYGGPRIGRLAYISLVYDFKKK